MIKRTLFSICFILIIACSNKAYKKQKIKAVSFNKVVDYFITNEVKTRSKIFEEKSPYLYIDVFSEEGLQNNSSILLTIKLYRQDQLFGVKDSIYKCNGIETFFGSTSKEYKSQFKKEYLKYIDNSKKKNKRNTFNDPIASAQFYFNKKNEIVYISPEIQSKKYKSLLSNKALKK